MKKEGQDDGVLPVQHTHDLQLAGGVGRYPEVAGGDIGVSHAKSVLQIIFWDEGGGKLEVELEVFDVVCRGLFLIAVILSSEPSVGRPRRAELFQIGELFPRSCLQS